MAETPDRKSFLRKRWRKPPAWLTVLLTVVVPIVSVSFAWWLTHYSNRTRQFPYYVSSISGVLRKPDLQGKDVKVLVDNRPLENISTVAVALFNNSDQDFDDVPIEVTFTGSTGRPAVIQATAHEPWKNEISTPTTQPTIDSDGVLRYRYLLQVANHSTQQLWTGSYAFEGGQAPAVRVNVLKKGIQAKFAELETEKPTTGEKFAQWFPAACSLATLILLVFLTRSLQRFNRSREDIIRQDATKMEAAEQPESPSLTS